MPGINILKHERQYGFGGEKGEKSATEVFREQMLVYKNKVLDLHPILARGYFDHLIEYKKESDPPVLEWKKDLIDQLSWERLADILNICEKVKDEQTRRY